MIILLNTSGSFCKLTIIEDDARRNVEWEANRELAKGLLGFLEVELGKQHKSFNDITAIGVYEGPGSFTGLRIGLTVANTLADGLSVPIVGETGEDWQEKALSRIEKGENQRIVMPLYGSDPHITPPRK